MKAFFKFFDVLEDDVRAWLAKRPILYGMIAGIGAVLFFRGIWHIADEVGMGSMTSLVLSLIILLITGSFVAHFVSNEVILSGLRKEKKLIEKTEGEVASEAVTLVHIKDELKTIQKEIAEIKQKLG
mgnify:CR=1 FL=1